MQPVDNRRRWVKVIMRRRATERFPLRFTRRLVPFKGHKKDPAENGTTVQESRHVGLHIAANIAVITVRRPGKMNAINAKMWTDLTETVRKASRDDRVRALVFRGEGDNFSAGSDLKELGRSSLPHAEDIFHRMEECAATIEESPLPSIACIRGYALGTGLLLALACDLRVAHNGATMGMPIARLGITLTEPFVKRLVSLIGPARTKDLVYTGRLIEAPEALRWGLVDRLVDEDRSVLRETLRVADVITRQSSASVRAAKRWAGSGSGRTPAVYNYVDPEDFPEGIQAFLERRQPQFDRRGKAPARAKQ
jgi:enoyl-CoA hydratase